MFNRFIELGLVATGLVAALTGCRSAPDAGSEAPLAQPALRVRESYAPGDVLAGPGAARAGPAVESSARTVRCRLLYLERALAAGLDPLERAGQFVVDLRAAAPVLETPRLVAGGRVGSGARAEEWLAALERGEAGRTRELFTGRPVLLAGATYTVEASAFETVEDPLDWLDEFPDRGPIERVVTFALTADAAGPRLVLGVADLDPDEEARRREERLETGRTRPRPPQSADREVLRRETFLVDVTLIPGELLVATLPSPFTGGAGRSFALVVEADPGPPEPERVAAVEAAVARVGELHAQRTGSISVAEVVELLRAQALRAFEERRSRSALLLLAAETDALLAEDLALSAPDEFVDELSRRVFAEDSEEVTQDFGWRLESSAFRLVCERALEDDSPEVRAPLYRHAGALAAFPDVVLDAVAASATLDGLRARLVEEQRYFLDDPDASARLRAHDWLVARGLAVEGYDPFAPREERRAALERARESREAAAQEGGG